MKKFVLTTILLITAMTCLASIADTSLPAAFSSGNPASVASGSDPIDKIIDISLSIMVSLTAGAACLKLLLTWKENRDADREEAREKELWR